MTTTYTEAEEAANALKMRFLDAVAAGPHALAETVQEEAQKARNSADFKAVTHFALAARNTQDFFERDKQLYNFFGSVADAVENFALWELSEKARAYFFDNYAFLPEEKHGVIL